MDGRILSEHEVVLQVARHWHDRLPFPACYAEEFEKLFAEQENLTATTYDACCHKQSQADVGNNLVMLLFFCQALSERYAAAGIPDSILVMTMGDLVIAVQRYHALHGHIGIANLSDWEDYIHMRLFRLGRLQFCMTGAAMDIPEKGITAGEPVMDVHVPAGQPLTEAACEDAFRQAESFFGTFFPQYHYRYYTCFSWLFDEVLQQFLKDDANILKFQKLFQPVYRRPQDSILHFLFLFGIESREQLHSCQAKTDFARKVKEYALNGGVFYNVLAVKEHH